MSFNLATILRESAHSSPAKPAVILDSLRFSYAELDAASDRVAANLRSAGVEQGQAVAVMLPNLPHFLMAYFGILKVGAVMVPMNVLLRAPEVAHYIGDSGAVGFIVWDGIAAEAMLGARQVASPVTWVVRTGAGDLPDGARDFAELTAGTGSFPMVLTAPEDVAVIIYTSGTTGQPKGAELTHFQLYMNCDVAGRVFGVFPDDIACGVLPLFHVFGLSSVANVIIRYGGTLSLVTRFEARKVLEVIARDRISVFSGVPTMFIALLHEPELGAYDTSSLRVANSGGASIPAEVLRAFEERFGVPVLEGYGLSETASAACFNTLDQRKPLSIGKPMWGVEARIVDDQNMPLPAGPDNIGEIVLRGHNIMKGYHGRPDATAEAFAGGWFHSGDLAYGDDDGFFYIVDRIKELIIRGGYNVYPREVEEVLYQHPAVAEAAVIGMPEERLGEEVAAVVALKPGASVTEAELIAFVRERLAAYKHPRSIRFLASLPKGATGKVLKKDLKADLFTPTT